MTVLLVDDDEDQLFVREMLFAQAGFIVLKAAAPSEALQIAHQNKLSCAVLDLCLPQEKDGLKLIRELKQIDPSLPLAVLTGKRIPGLQNRPEAKLIAAVITKGTPSAQLLATIRALCK